ncbi:hemagglutinin repeat-containing protein [Buttiauxella ferragutiae]|uniref:hemagglutinin repeat-containing protein n=1 Tax=Buttiauxella ferragutiae TaxID=82989 RepID=UPI001F539C0F|nr:hemagglutinin repeat-containing protein [Buttiauxella ferragutiae]UNK63019.1 hemagglutinin repeat-containing protein [Buttiauxella ferragutiae]
MNKLFYRIIFNQARGLLMVVADITRSHRAGVSPSSDPDNKTPAELTARLSPLALGLLLTFGWITPVTAGVVADRSAPGNQQPQITHSASGTMQVNIQTPSTGGVSRNTYSQFDVDNHGAILNNSHSNTQTRLGGMVAANPNLAKGEATVILNEVNSRDPSQLKGYIEVAGQKAQVVIANPSGISCDGCGFINANRATLTTGTPQFSHDNLTGYRVNGGEITITGSGLDSSAQDYTDIIARSVKVNAGVRARDLKVTTGRNQVDAAHQTITALDDDGSAKPGMALDVSALGGMYAGKIRLTGTEKGVGVNNAGEMGATAGNVVLTADGRIENSGQISSSGDTQIASHGDISNSGGIHSQQQITISSDGTLTNSGSLASGGSLTASAKTVNSTTGSLLAAGVDSAGKLTQPGDITLSADGQLSANGRNLAGGGIQAKGKGMDISGSQTAAKSISLDAQNADLSTRHATVEAEQTLIAHTTAALNNDGGSLTANKLTLSSHDLSNRSGMLVQVGEDDFSLNPAGKLDNHGGHIRSNSKNLTLSATALDNSEGEVTHAGAGELHLAAEQGINNEAGSVKSAGDLISASVDFNNASGQFAATRKLDLKATTLSNQSGSIDSGGDAAIALSGGMDNRQGKLISGGKLTLTTTDLLNQQGLLAGGGAFSLHASSLDNQGGNIKAGGNAQFAISQQLDNSHNGVIGTDGNLDVQAASVLNNQGKLIARGNGKIDSALINNRGGQLAVQSVLDLHADTLNNDDAGQLQSGGDMTLTVSHLSNTGTVDAGGISSNGHLTLTTSSLDNNTGLLLAGKSLTLLNTLLANQGGQIVSQGALAVSTTGDLNNQNGVIQGSGITLDTQGHALNNQSGTLYSLAALAVNSRDLNNQGGTLGAKGDTTLTVSTLDNRNSGRVVSAQSALVTAQSLQNQQGQIQSAGDLRLNLTGLLNNQHGLIRSGVTTTVQAQQADNSNTQGTDQGIEGQTIALTSDSLNNQEGSLLANSDLTLTVAGALNNTRGLISASRTLLAKGSALQLTNTGGTLSAGSQLTLNADSLSGDGKLLSVGNMTVTSQQDFSNQGTLIANQNLTLTINGDGVNSGKILAGDTLTLNADNLSNLKSGEINAGTDRLTLAKTLTNTGLIDGGLTWLEANTLNNTGSGRIYGDSIGVNVITFNNKAADGVAPVLAGRMQVNIGAQTLNNYAHALIYSDGTLSVGGQLASDGAVTGQAGEINNHSATMESAGDTQLNVKRLNNINDHFSTERVTVSVIDKLLYQWKGVTYDTADYKVSLNKDETWIICIEGVTCHDSGSGDNFNEYRYTETTKETQVKESDPAKLLAGGNLTINGNTVYNENSEIVAGKTLTVNADNVDNHQTEGQRIITDDGTLKHYYRKHHKGGDSPGIDTSDYRPPDTIQTIALNPGRMDGNSRFSGSGETIDAQGNRTTDVSTGGAGNTSTHVNGSNKTPVQIPPGTQFDVAPESGEKDTVIRTVTPDTRLPDNSLFTVMTDNNSRYLVQTDPRFTNNKKWLASDYMQEQLGLDQTMKRLGDGYYEQRLVREQIIAMSGRRYLDGYSSDEEEYKALMDNGVAFAKQYHLRPGVALSAEQMAKLTRPLVWLVNSTITLADGSQQTVRVPQVYAQVKAGDLNSSGALMSGGNVAMNLTGNLANSGVIGGHKATSITAENILNNAGSIQGADVSLTARNDITSIGGSLQGLDSLVANAGRDINITTTTRSAGSQNVTSQFSRTTLDKVASMSVVNDGGTLVLNAGRDANLTAAQVVNSGHDSKTLLAAGRDVNLNTVTTASQDDVAWNKDNTLHQAQRNEVGSDIAAGGGVSVAAGQDIHVRAGNINANDALNLAAGRDISVVSGENHSELDERHKETGSSGMFSKTTTTTRDTWNNNSAQASQLGGNTISLGAGHDLLIKGSGVAGTQDVSLRGGHDVTLTAAEESHQELHLMQQKKSGLSGTGGIGISYGTRDLKTTDTTTTHNSAGSTVGSVGGNVKIVAGNGLTVKGSDVIAGGNMALQGKHVDILAADNDSSQTHKVEQKTSGLTLALSGTVGSAINQAVTTVSDARKEDSGRLAALDGVKAALSGVQAYQGNQLAQAQGDPGSMIGVNLSYGSQKSTSTRTQTNHDSQGSTVQAGKNLSIHATGSDITVQGAQIKAGNDITLEAARDVNLLSAENTRQLEGKNESQGGSVGVGINFGSGSNGISVNASVNKGKGSEKGNGTTHTETTLDAGNRLNITSGRDTTLIGAQANGDKVTLDVGRNLSLSSEQDSDNYDSKQQNASAGGSVSMGGGSASVSLSQDKMHSTWDAVKEQSGIFAGHGGFDITVGKHTQLNGAVMSSTADASKNKLDTGTLGFSNIDNHAEYSVEHQSAGISTAGSIGSQFLGNASSTLLVGANGKGSTASTTKSAVSAGRITVRDKDHQTQNIADLSEDVAHANPGLDVIFDKEKEQNRLKEAQMTGEIGNQVMDIAKTQGDIADAKAQKDPKAREDAKKALARQGVRHPTDKQISEQVSATATAPYGPGSDLQRGLQAATAAVQGLGGGDMAKAIAGGLSPYMAELIHNQTTSPDGTVNKTANAMAHAVWGAIAARASGNSALAGAGGAVSGELMARTIGGILYPDVKPENMTGEQKQTLSVLGTLAAGLAGGLAGDSSANAVAGAQAGKNAVENNYLSDKQKTQREKEFADCNDSTACKLQVGSKWDLIDAGQQTSYGAGMLVGVPAGLVDSVQSIVNMGLSPVETYDALRSLFNSGDVLGNVSDAVKQSYIARINYMEAEYQKAGASGSFNAGVEGGKLITDIASLVAGGAGIAKGGVALTEKIAAKVAGKAESAAANAGNAAHNAANYAGLKLDLKTTEAANDLVDSLRNTGQLPQNYVNKMDAYAAGWSEGKAVNNYVPGGQIGGDIFRNSDGLLPSAPGRTWFEADIGLSNTMSRSNAAQPASRLLYSSDGLLYVTPDHYGSFIPVGTWK